MNTAGLDAAGLVAWFHRQGRIFPWSLTSDPYAIWISEVMLQQTVVSAAVEHYELWLKRWPDLASLSKASEEEVLRAWEGLGYATRGVNLHKAAQILVRSGRVGLPSTYEELRALPGVGDYTASAVLSFAFHQPFLTLDANLKRVFQRWGGSPLWTEAFERSVRGSIPGLFSQFSSRDLNLALMQLGQLVCTPRSPDCPSCPLQKGCTALREETQNEIPKRAARGKIEKETEVAVWIEKEGRRVFLARPVKGRFSTLWLFPPFSEPPAGAENEPPGPRLKKRIHSYTKYRDRLSPRVVYWTSAGSPPLPQGWTGRWAGLDEASGAPMASTYRKIFDETVKFYFHVIL